MQDRPKAGNPSRRLALKRIGLGLGAAAAASRCGAPPSLPDRCRYRTDEEVAALAAGGLRAIDAFVVVMMENRSFDHYLGPLRRDSGYPSRGLVEGLRGDESNPDETGRPVGVWRLPDEGRLNPDHQWEPMRRTFNGGRNDGFVVVNAGRAFHQEVMGYHDRERLPFHYALADNFTVCDRWFSSVMGPTWPNRFYLHAATSGGHRKNNPLGFDAPPTVWEMMALGCRSARNYCAGPLPWYHAAFPAKSLSGEGALVPGTIEEFFRDARTGNLPELSIVDPDYLSNDGHPRHGLALSEAFLASIYRALAEGPQWSRSLLVITYDEHGGFFDHVPPPLTVDPRPEFRQLGFRVPTLVVGPQVWRGRPVSTVLEHVSVLASLRSRFGIGSLGPRMDAANDLACCIDPARIDDPARPPRIDPVELGRRVAAAPPATGSSQREIEEALADGRVPAELVDGRPADERFRSWLRHAQDLEAVRVVR